MRARTRSVAPTATLSAAPIVLLVGARLFARGRTGENGYRLREAGPAAPVVDLPDSGQLATASDRDAGMPRPVVLSSPT